MSQQISVMLCELLIQYLEFINVFKTHLTFPHKHYM